MRTGFWRMTAILIPVLLLGVAVLLGGCGGGSDSGGSTSSVPPTITRNTVHLQSDPGDNVWHGKTYDYDQTDSVITVTANGARLKVQVQGDQTWNGEFQLPTGAIMVQPGTYANAQNASYQNAIPGLSWSGDGLGIDTKNGSFTIDKATYTGSKLTALDLRFALQSTSPTLHGTIHWDAADTTKPSGPVVPIPSNLWQPAAGTTPATGNYIYLQSEPGYSIGQGKNYLFTPDTSTITLDTTPLVPLDPTLGGNLVVRVSGVDNANGTFQLPNILTRFQVGYYGGLADPFSNPTKGGLSWTQLSAGNEATGWYAVDKAVYTNGVLTAIDLRFEQHDGTATPALHGKIHWDTANTTAPINPIVPIPTDLWKPAADATPTTGNYVYLQGEPGFETLNGETIVYTPPATTITVTESNDGLLRVETLGNGSNMTGMATGDNTPSFGNFKLPTGQSRFKVGWYSALTAYPAQTTPKGGLAWTQTGSACDTVIGWYIVDSVTYTGNELTAIDLRFEQHCDGLAPALHGQIHWAK